MTTGRAEMDSPATSGLVQVLGQLSAIRAATEAIRETLLANLVMVGEIPSPTFQEEARVRFVRDRFNECGLQNCSTDEVGNVLGVMPGEDSARNILLVAHTDTEFPATVDHTITVHEDRIVGPGVGDNSLGVAAMITLPALLEQLEISLGSNLVLMGSVRSLGRGDLEGLRFFLGHTAMPIQAGVCVEGVQLGRLSYSCIGMMRGEITVEVPEEYDWTRFGASGAIRILNDVINRIEEIRLPAQPRTSILLGSIRGGTSFNTNATQGVLRFEIRSESQEMVNDISRILGEITAEVSAQTRAGVELEIIAHRDPGGVSFTHPLARHARQIMESLEVEPRLAPSISELSSFIAHEIPAITLGISRGENLGKTGELVQIDSMYTGMAQLLAVILAIDRGLCDED